MPNSPRDDDRSSLEMVRVAQLHYLDNRSPAEIAQKLSLSVQRVDEILVSAREVGIVRVEIVDPLARRLDLERRLKDRFSLRDTIVVPGVISTHGNSEHQIRGRVIAAAVGYLVELDPPPRVLGVGGGSTVVEIADGLPEKWGTGVSVVQLGGVDSIGSSGRSAGDAASLIANKGGGSVTWLAAPTVQASREARYAREADPETARILRLGSTASAYLFGANSVDSGSLFERREHLSAEDVAGVARGGAVGEILGHFIDSRGRIVDGDLEDRTLGLGLDDLRDAGWAIAVISGNRTHSVARAIVRSGLCTVLITDDATALAVLED